MLRCKKREESSVDQKNRNSYISINQICVNGPIFSFSQQMVQPSSFSQSSDYTVTLSQGAQKEHNVLAAFVMKGLEKETVTHLIRKDDGLVLVEEKSTLVFTVQTKSKKR